MYVVILAGGGGTRLWPLSRPERPKPFLPLLGPESLFQRTVARLLDGPELRDGPGLTPADITVVTEARYEALVRDQRPDVAVLAEPVGRNTSAAIALATLAIDRPDDEVMLVLPADSHIDPAREDVYRTTLAGAAVLATGCLGIEDPLVTLGVQMTGPSTQYGYLKPLRDTRQSVAGVDAYRLQAFEEKPTLARAEELFAEGAGIAWNAGIFCWRRRAIRAALARRTALLEALAPGVPGGSARERAYGHIQRPMSIDHAVMEKEAGDGHVVMGAMDVGWSDLGSWTALLEALGVGGEGRVVQAGETTTVTAADLIVRRTDGRVSAVPPFEAGSMTAAQPVAILAGVAGRAAAVHAMLDRCSEQEAAA